MSKLLISEEPLQVLPSLAAQIGLNEALLIQQLHYWLNKSKHEHDERRWIYNTFEEWQAQFPLWSERTLQRAMANLVKLGLVRVRRFNEKDRDQTNWYAIEYGELETYENKSVEILRLSVEKRAAIATKRRGRGRQIVGLQNDKLS
jgi:hypothetical protein